VKCDSENNPHTSIDQGIVDILVGFAPLYAAELVVIQIEQLARQTQSYNRRGRMRSSQAMTRRILHPLIARLALPGSNP
jgi:hypothetical protein